MNRIASLSLALLMGCAVAASAQPQATSATADALAPRSSSTIFRVDPAFQLDKPEIDDGWMRLGGISNTSEVRIQMRNGRAYRGTIHAVRPESLDFVLGGAADSAMRLERQQIQWVRRDVRRKMQIIGTAVGVLAGAIVDATYVKQHRDAPPVYFLLLGAAGLAAGTFLPGERTLWENPAKQP